MLRSPHMPTIPAAATPRPPTVQPSPNATPSDPGAKIALLVFILVGMGFSISGLVFWRPEHVRYDQQDKYKVAIEETENGQR